MKRWLIGATALLLLAAMPRPTSAAPPDSKRITLEELPGFQQAFSKLAADVRPSVVSIHARRDMVARDGGSISVPVSHGSGFVLTADGLVLTNHHVIEDANTIEVTLLGGRMYEGQVVQIDPRSDLAVLRIEAHNLRVAPLADNDAVRVGQWAFTVGNPFGLARHDGNSSFSVGVVSSLGRSLTDEIATGPYDRYYGNLIETDASINPGNSGGPLFNIDGHVIGIATAMRSDSGVNEGLGYAIPINRHTRRIIDLLVTGKKVRYGYMGVEVQTPRFDEARQQGIPSGRGALVTSLTRNPARSPASQAGLRRDDIITEVDGVPVHDHYELIRVIGSTPVDSAVKVVYYRDKRRYETMVTLADRSVALAGAQQSQRSDEPVRVLTWRGAELVELSKALLESLENAATDPGLFVHEIDESSELFKQGLRQEMIVVKCNGRRIQSIDDLMEAEQAARRRLRLITDDGQVIIVPKG